MDERTGVIDEKGTQTAPRRIPGYDVETLKLCLAVAWAKRAISGGRAREVAESCGWPWEEVTALAVEDEA